MTELNMNQNILKGFYILKALSNTLALFELIMNNNKNDNTFTF